MNTNVRDIPPAVYDKLRAKAKENRRSINGEMIVAIEKHVAEQKESK
jgi:hypothetical protein